MKLHKVAPLIIAFPAVTIGAITMHLYGIKATTYGLNIISFLVCGCISYFLIGEKAVEARNKYYTEALLVTGVMLLFFTFFDSGIQGIHRWVTVGPAKFYISSIVLPGIIIGLWELLQKNKWWLTYCIAFLMNILLSLQPDASQLTAFTLPMIILLFLRSDKVILKRFCTAFLTSFIIYLWINLDSLPPVVYVENIIQLAGSLGLLWAVFGIGSLLLLPIPFIFFSPTGFKDISICLGIYFITVLASTQFGNFPVPLMGYGISPIIGYFISITWLENTRMKVQ